MSKLVPNASFGNSERLINRKLDLRKLNIMREWNLSLNEYLNEYYANYLL